MSESNALPGLEALLEPQNARPGDVDMSDGKVYTAEKLFKQHPLVFKSAARLLFREMLSERSVAAALMLSVNTVRAIRDMVVAGQGPSDAAAAAFFIKSKASSSRKLLQLRALEAIHDRIENDELSQISIESLLNVVKAVDTLEAPAVSTEKKTGDDIIDVEAFDEVLNGLNEGGNPRAADSAAGGADDVPRMPGADDPTGPECSTGSAK